MAQLERTRDQITRADVSSIDRPTFRSGIDDLAIRPEEEMPPGIKEERSLSNSPEVLFKPPDWLKGLFPIQWSVADASARKTDAVGRNCCLFYPLGYCRDSTDLVNGFCMFHLRAIFNVVYQTDSVYQINANGEPSISQRTACFVSDPQPVDDRYTAIFPLMEVAGETELEAKDIRMFHLVKYLQAKRWSNWERVYSHHVNYLHRLITLYSPKQCESRPVDARENQMSSTQLMMHWNLWNEYHSKLLADHPADINLLYVGSQKGDGEEILSLPLRKCTTITQMVGRLFSEPYVNLNDRRYYSTVASYGVYRSNHWSYANNLCSIGTHCTKSGIMCIGNAATINLLRATGVGGCRIKTIHYSNMADCEANLCMPPLLNPEVSMLNQSVAHVKR